MIIVPCLLAFILLSAKLMWYFGQCLICRVYFLLSNGEIKDFVYRRLYKPSNLVFLCRPEHQRHDWWCSGLEGSELGEAGGPQSSAGGPAQTRHGELPSRCRTGTGEHISLFLTDRISLACNPDTFSGSAFITSSTLLGDAHTTDHAWRRLSWPLSRSIIQLNIAYLLSIIQK